MKMNIIQFFILFLTLTFIGCSQPAQNTNKVKDIYKIDYDYELSEDTFTQEDFNMIQKAIGIKFPKDSRGLNLFFKGECIDPAFVAKVKIYEPAHKEFIKQLEKLPNLRGSMSNSLTEKLPWWKVSKNTLYLKRMYYEHSVLTKIFLCKEDEEWILYIVWVTA